MDIIHDALADWRPIPGTVVEQWCLQSRILEVGSSLSGATVGIALDWVLPAVQGRGRPEGRLEFRTRVRLRC